MPNKSHTAVTIREKTYSKLDKARSEGQSFDGKIRELLKRADENE